MLQSKLFTKTRKEAPSDEVSKNAQLLIRGGFVHKEMAGVYSYLPLGMRVLSKINNIIREEMNAVGGQEVQMTVLQEKSLWEKTKRFADEDVDIWFKTKLKNDTELGLGFTHEEPMTALLTNHVHSFRDLPALVYQIQTKFRNEARAKSGIMRGREFLMKDLYSFCRDDKEQAKVYESLTGAYHRVFERVGIGELTFKTFASGGVFSKYSHEFQTVCDTGEDLIYVNEGERIAVNKEVLNDEVLRDLDLRRENLVERKAVEVGNIFNLGTRFSEPLGLFYSDEKGDKHPVVMGSYGIGPTRLMGVVVEVLSDERGIIWPETIAPFKVHILSFEENDKAKEIYEELTGKGVEVLFDDREVSPGVKLSDADLLGIPYRVVVSAKSAAAGGYEIKKRNESEARVVSGEELIGLLSK